MVKSILNNNINYPELKLLDNEDADYDASLYEIELLKVDVIIALGQAKYQFIDNNIIYYPIYLVKNDSFDTQIGVFEILADNLPNLIDEDGDIDLDKLDKPLLYKYTTVELLKLSENKNDDGDDDDEEKDNEENENDDDDDEDDENEDDDDENKIISVDEYMLPEQTEEQMELETSTYSKDKNDPWIQIFLKSNEYTIIDNEGGGDCLFATIRDALKSVNKDITVLELRQKIANEATQEIFENYKEKYDMFLHSIQTDEQELNQLKKKNNELRDRLKHSKERDEQTFIVEQAKEIAVKFKALKEENTISKQLFHEFNFMRNINNIEEFKKMITTCEFWGDTWAISTLERVLNIKLIIFSSEHYKQHDTNNVLQCGQLNDSILEDEGSFEPEYYILLDYTGTHYKLITYKHHTVFNFVQIPYVIKLLVANKCVENMAGPYYIIPQFKLFNEELGIEEPIELNVDVIQESKNDLYDPETILQYYIKSNNKPLPGKGNGESIDDINIKKYAKLTSIDEWRRKLDNKYNSEFSLDNHKWSSVEHYYQASKFKDTNKEFYLLFSLDSDSKISKNIDLAIAAGSKSGKHKGDLLRQKDIKIDPNFYNEKDQQALEDALYAKFTSTDELKTLLKETKKASLYHYKRGAEAELSNILMMVRNRIQKEKI